MTVEFRAEAFTLGLQTSALVSAVIAAVSAVLAAVLLRNVRMGSDQATADAPQPTTTAIPVAEFE